MVNRVVVGAHYGLCDWLMQRVTAVIMLVYTLALVALLFCLPHEYAAWQTFFQQTWVRVFSLVTILALALHAWVGVRDIWMDYVQPVGLRLSLHCLTIVFLLANFIWAICILWSV